MVVQCGCVLIYFVGVLFSIIWLAEYRLQHHDYGLLPSNSSDKVNSANIGKLGLVMLHYGLSAVIWTCYSLYAYLSPGVPYFLALLVKVQEWCILGLLLSRAVQRSLENVELWEVLSNTAALALSCEVLLWLAT